MFLSRLAPDTPCDDIVQYAKNTLNVVVKCEKLRTKFDNYSSFKVDAVCDDPSMLYKSESWPQGVLVRKFYVKRS